MSVGRRSRHGPPAPRSGPREAVAALAAALVLGGCPLPQPLPTVAATDGGAVTSLRIRLETVRPDDPIVFVSRTCAGGQPRIALTLSLDDPDAAEAVEARWFLDYQPSATLPFRSDDVPSPQDPNDPTRRDLPALGAPPIVTGDPAAGTWLDPAVQRHVVELVVAGGGFAHPVGQDTAATYPNRTPQGGYGAAQVYRWVFQWVDDGGRCK